MLCASATIILETLTYLLTMHQRDYSYPSGSILCLRCVVATRKIRNQKLPTHTGWRKKYATTESSVSRTKACQWD